MIMFLFHYLQIIDVEKSNVKLLGAKVEIVLKKGSPEKWAQLQYKPHPKEEISNTE